MVQLLTRMIMDPSLPTQSRQTVQYQGIVRTPTENTR